MKKLILRKNIYHTTEPFCIVDVNIMPKLALVVNLV